MIHVSRATVAALVIACGARLAAAQPKEIVIETPGERSTENKLLLAALAGAGVLAGGLGLYWHLDARSASNDVSSDSFTGRAWTAEDAALVDQADRSRGRAVVAYGIGGGLLVAAVVALIMTEPASETTVIRPHAPPLNPVVTPVPGGAVLGGGWRF